MITRIEIDGFKSFSNFEMEFSPLTVIAGTNASGKSNLFDALHLLSNLAQTDLRSAYSNKLLRGDVAELFTKYDEEHYASQMRFAVEILVSRKIADNWGREADIKTPRMRYELTIEKRKNNHGYDELAVAHEELSKISTNDDTWAKRHLGNKRKTIWKNNLGGGSGTPYIHTQEENGLPTIKIRQDSGQGGRSVIANAVNQTVLSSINSVDFPHIFAARQEIASWNFMQLNPELLREPTRYDANYRDTIGHAGEDMAAALYRLKSENPYTLQQIIVKLSSFLPDYVKLHVKDDKANKLFIFELENVSGKVFSSRVLSEGTLRLLVLCVMLYDDKFRGLLCFEEPENGIHPFRMRAMVELLHSLASDFEDDDDNLRQVIVNTHSPKLLYYLKYIYNDQDPNVSIWLSKLVTYIAHTENGNVKLRISKILPITSAYSDMFSRPEFEMTIADAEQYLETEQITAQG